MAPRTATVSLAAICVFVGLFFLGLFVLDESMVVESSLAGLGYGNADARQPMPSAGAAPPPKPDLDGREKDSQLDFPKPAVAAPDPMKKTPLPALSRSPNEQGKSATSDSLIDHHPLPHPRLSQDTLAVSSGASLFIHHSFSIPGKRKCALYYDTHTNGLVPPLLVWNASAVEISPNKFLCQVPPIRREPIAFDVWRYPMDYGAASPFMGGPYLLYLNNTANSSDFFVWPMILYVASDNVTLERPLAHGGFPRGCSVEDYTALRKVLQASQFPDPKECSKRYYFRQDFTNTGIGMNIAAFLHLTVRSALRAMEPSDNVSMPLVLTLQSPDAWRQTRLCTKTLAYECLFDSISSCNASAISPRHLVPKEWKLSQPVFAPPRSKFDRANPILDKCGETAVAAAIVAQFTPVRPDLKEEFARRLDLLHAGPKHNYNCIAVHIRQGERGSNRVKWGLKFMPRYSLGDVVRFVKPLAEAVGIRDIVFGTDGTELLEEARRYNGTDLVFHVNGDIKRAVDGSDCLRESVVGCTPGLTPEDVRFAILLDVEALGNCKYFMGTMRSTFTKLAFLRALGNGVAVHDGISLD